MMVYRNQRGQAVPRTLKFDRGVLAQLHQQAAHRSQLAACLVEPLRRVRASEDEEMEDCPSNWLWVIVSRCVRIHRL